MSRRAGRGAWRPLLVRLCALGAGLVPALAHEGPSVIPAWDAKPPPGWQLLERAERTHGGKSRWKRIRDLRLVVERTWRDAAGRPVRTERETQRILKGRRPRVRIERPGPDGLLVMGLDGHRAWVTLDGRRLGGERALAEAEEATRWAGFLARLPFVLLEKDSRALYRGTGSLGRRPTLVVDVGFVGGTRPSEARYEAHLDATQYRLVRLDHDSRRFPGARHRLEFREHSTFAGVLIPRLRIDRREDDLGWMEEKLEGIALNECPLEELFEPPVRGP